MENNIDWSEYFASIVSVCPWSKSYWKKQQIDIQTWRGTQHILPLGKYVARMYIHKHASEITLAGLKNRMNNTRPHEEWLYSDGGEFGTPVPVLIQQDLVTLTRARRNKHEKNMEKNIENYIFHYKNFLDEKFCDKCIQKLDEAGETIDDIIGWSRHNWYDEFTHEFNDNKHNHEKSTIEPWTIMRQNYSEDIQEINNNIIEELYTKIEDYFKMIEEVASTPYIWHGYSALKFIKYDKGSTMKKHWDSVSDLFNSEGIPKLTILGLLNNDYEGGDLTLCGDKKIDTKKGDLIIFPSTFLYPHEISEVTEGNRYSYVSWVW